MGDVVHKVYKLVDWRQNNQWIEKICDVEKPSIKELQAGSRRGRISEVRGRIVRLLVEEYGLPLALIAREVGVSTSAISNILKRGTVHIKKLFLADTSPNREKINRTFQTPVA